jgi:hypothetical protein
MVWIYFNTVIEWLHKQLNDEALNRPISGYNSRPPTGNNYGTLDFDKYAIQPSVEVWIYLTSEAFSITCSSLSITICAC